MNLSNYHSHSTYCDGQASVEEMLLEAIRLGFTSYGSSSHGPLPFSTSWNMEWDKMEEYLAECFQLQEKYRSQIEFYVGLEIDYLSDTYNPSCDEFTRLGLDYSIGSVHLLGLDTGGYVDIDTGAELFSEQVAKYFNGDYEELIYRYFDAMRALIRVGGFDILGHCDKVSKNSAACAKGICESSFYKHLIRDYFEFIAQHGCLVEVNTKAYPHIGEFFPNTAHFKLLRELEVAVVVSSDAHRVEKLNAGRAEALKALFQAGYTTVKELHQNKWVDTPIHKVYQ